MRSAEESASFCVQSLVQNTEVDFRNKMEDEALIDHYNLLAKTQSTVEGILASGRSDIWSTYGALRRAREVLNRIFLHELLIENEEVGLPIILIFAF